MRRAPALSFLLLTVAIDMLGLGLIVPILPALMTAVTGQATSGAGWSGVIGSSYGLLQFAWSASGSASWPARPSAACSGRSTCACLFVAAGLAFANAAYGFAILPESRRGDRTTPLTLRVANPVGALASVLRRPVLGRLASARFCADVARMTEQVIWTFFITYRLAWGTAQVGVTMAAAALAGVAVQARLAGPGVRWLGEKRAAVLGSALGVIALGGTAFVSGPWALSVLLAVGALSSVGDAAAQSWISRATGADEQGTVQGTPAGIGAIAEAVVPVAAGATFAWSLTSALPGLVFLAAAAFAAAATIALATAPPVDGQKRGVDRIGGSPGSGHAGTMRERVLIVDDHDGFRAVARKLLSGAGFDVVGEAVDGNSGLAAARTTRPDVVLLDVQLPDLDGFRVAAELAADPQPPAVVLVSTRSSDEYGGLIGRSPARGFIAKAELTGQSLRELLNR